MSAHEGSPMTSQEPEDAALRLVALARDWLAAERMVTGLDRAARHEARARVLSAEYDAAVSAASPTLLEEAWQAAQSAQASSPAGSTQWSESEHVVRLLRAEYLACAAEGP